MNLPYISNENGMVKPLLFVRPMRILGETYYGGCYENF